jgi:hypothetical protein
MSADINRKSLDPQETHFSQMLFHQGRVMLPSELNENGAIFQYYLRQFIMDFVGKHWRAGADSFNIGIDKKTFKISKGHFYVDGILCVNEVDCFYSPKDEETVQPMFPTPEWGKIKDEDLPKDFAVYLECWERHVNWIQRPQIREVALGGRDTSSRLEIAWQVRLLTSELAKSYVTDITDALEKRSQKPNKIIQTINGTVNNFKKKLNSSQQADHCNATQDLLELLDDADPKLRVWAKKSADAAEPCSISPDAQYRGLENQLYRVEIHRPGVVRVGNGSMQPKPSFKWSRENGSVVFRIIKVKSSLSSIKDENVINLIVDLDILGRDNRYGLCVNDWVELTNDEVEFGQKVLPLAQIMKIDPTLGRLTLSTLSNENPIADFSGCTMLRRWDQTENCNKVNKEGTINIEKEGDEDEGDSWVLLERGIKIQFQPGGNYRKGDYWLIPARVATGDVEWPKKEDNKGNYIPDARSTDGIKRHRAALGVVSGGRLVRPSCSCTVNPACETNP